MISLPEFPQGHPGCGRGWHEGCSGHQCLCHLSVCPTQSTSPAVQPAFPRGDLLYRHPEHPLPGQGRQPHETIALPELPVYGRAWPGGLCFGREGQEVEDARSPGRSCWRGGGTWGVPDGRGLDPQLSRVMQPRADHVISLNKFLPQKVGESLPGWLCELNKRWLRGAWL